MVPHEGPQSSEALIYFHSAGEELSGCFTLKTTYTCIIQPQKMFSITFIQSLILQKITLLFAVSTTHCYDCHYGLNY